MAITIEVPDELGNRLQAQAEQAFASDLNAVATAALEHYLTTQELMQQLVVSPPVTVTEEPQLLIDPNALLQQVGAQDIAAQDVLSGDVELPQQALDDIRDALGDVDVSEVLSGEFKVSPEAAAGLPAEVLVPSTGIVVHEPPPPAGDEEERLARVIAASGITSEQIASAAEGFDRIRQRIEELRSR
jgi:hypothetical protein